MPMPRKPVDEFRVVLSGRVPPGIKRAVRAIAHKEGLSMSRVVSRLIETGLIYDSKLTAQKSLKV